MHHEIVKAFELFLNSDSFGRNSLLFHAHIMVNKDLRVRDCLFVRCGSNGGVIWFNGDDVIRERDAIFKCEAIKSNSIVSGSFGCFNVDDDSTFNQLTVVETSPEENDVYYVNELSKAKYYSVFYLEMDPEDPYYFYRINQTDCYGKYYSSCFELSGGNSHCGISHSIFVHCVCQEEDSRVLIYIHDNKISLYSKLNYLYFVDCITNPYSTPYGCISTKNTRLISNNCYFIRCKMAALLNNEAGSFTISNFY